MKTPVVSVIVASRNAEATLGETLESVRAQTMTAWECIVVDDASTDGTAALVARAAADDPRIHLVRAAGHGAAAARNRALAETRGAFVAILDADDVAVPERFERQVAFLRGNVDLAGAASRAYLCVEAGRAVGISAVEGPSTREDLEALRAAGTLLVFCHPTVMWRAERLRALGGFDERFPVAHDAELVNRAVYERGWPFLLMPEPLIWYRLAAEGLSTTRLARQRMTLRYLEERNRAWVAGDEPSSLEAFLARPTDLRTRARWLRHDVGAALYRRAGILMGEGSRVRAVTPLVAATLLHPRYAIAKGWAQRASRTSRSALRSLGRASDG